MKSGTEKIGPSFGFSIVETLLAASIFSLIVTAFAGALIFSRESGVLSGNRLRASMFAEEGLEAARNIRDSGFVNLVDGTHGLATSGNQWVFSGVSDANGIFTRNIVISSIDSKRKLVASNVTWQQNLQRNGSISLMTRLTNWIISGIGNWGSPLKLAIYNASGNENGSKVVVERNYAYFVRDGGSPDFLVINISNPASPSLTGSLSLNGNPQNVFVSGNYAYVVSTDNSEELQIVDISNPASPLQTGSYNDAGNENALGVFVSGNTAYLLLAGGNEFVTVNIASPSSPSGLGALSLSGNAQEIVVLGNYAYVASTDNSEELQVVDVSNPSLPTQTSSLDLSGIDDALSVAGFGTTVIIGRSGGNVHTVNIGTPSSPTILGTFNALDNVNDISLGNANRYAFLASNENSAEFRVIDISAPAVPTNIGIFDHSSDIRGVAYSNDYDRVFAVNDSNSEEFIVIAPQ